MSQADGYVLPKSGIPKTLGIMSTIFAVLMILYGLCVTTMTAVTPAMMQSMEKIQKSATDQVEAQRQAEIKVVEDQEKAATTDEAKAAFKTQRAEIEARPKPEIPDMSGIVNASRTPTILTYTYANLLSGLVLALLLLIAGIGLIRLTPWGRTLAMGWAGAQILQVVVLAVVSLVVVLPVQQDAQKKVMEMAKAQPGNANNPGLQMAQAMSGSGIAEATVIFIAIVGCIFPIIVLILLNTKGARAACLPKSPSTLEGF